MNASYRLFFKYIFLTNTFIFFKNTAQHEKTTTLFLNKNLFYYLALHLKLSSLFYSTQLVDMFAYDLPIEQRSHSLNNGHGILGYAFQNLLTQDRFFIFTSLAPQTAYLNTNTNHLLSISELFPAANWLEREISELHAIEFFGKKDTRNLMLPYGDSSAPFKKAYPCVGLKEIYYEAISDQLVFNEVSLQF